jgi:hypothetical protein
MGAKRPSQLADNGEWIDTPSPQNWLAKWLAEQGKYVLLSCEHPEDLNYRGVLIVGDTVLCPVCEQWSTIRKSISLLRYVGLELQPTPDVPQY